LKLVNSYKIWLTGVHSEMADFGFRQGPSEFSTSPKTSLTTC